MRQNTINCTHHFSTLQIFFTFLMWRAFSTWQSVTWTISPHENLSCGGFLHMTNCYVKKFLHMTKTSPQAPPVMPVTNIRYGTFPVLKVKPIGLSVITQSCWSKSFRMSTNQNWMCSWMQRPTCQGWKPWKNIVERSATWRSLCWAARRTSWAGWPLRWPCTALNKAELPSGTQYEISITEAKS